MEMILVTTSLLSRGGSERVISKIAASFKTPVHCLAYDSDSTFEEFGDLEVQLPEPGRLSRLLSGGALEPVATASYFYNLKLEGYDLVSAQLAPTEFVRNRNSPVMWYCYTPYRSVFDLYEWKVSRSNWAQKAMQAGWSATFKQLEYGVVPKIECILTVSANCQGRIKRYLKRDAEVLHVGVDARRFACRDHERYFFYPSRLVPEKDFEYVIEAFRIFSSRMKGWRLVLGGSLSKEPRHSQYLNKLRAICGDSVSIETDLSEERLCDLYSRCYAVLYSPVDEDLGMVPLEGMASSKPCIAKNEGGPRETIMDGVDGFLVNSPAEMAARMEFLAKDPEQCVRMGKAGKRKVDTRFTWELFLKRFGEKAKEVVDGSSDSC